MCLKNFIKSMVEFMIGKVAKPEYSLTDWLLLYAMVMKRFKWIC